MKTTEIKSQLEGESIPDNNNYASDGVSPNWTNEELKIYILIYCSNADFLESKIETDYIRSKIKNGNFDKIHQEFEKDNDYQSIQKIQSSIIEHNHDNVESLLQEIKELFLTDDCFDIMEQNLYLGLKHLLK
jgi:hypothetical protein